MVLEYPWCGIDLDRCRVVLPRYKRPAGQLYVGQQSVLRLGNHPGSGRYYRIGLHQSQTPGSQRREELRIKLIDLAQ